MEKIDLDFIRSHYPAGLPDYAASNLIDRLLEEQGWSAEELKVKTGLTENQTTIRRDDLPITKE